MLRILPLLLLTVVHCQMGNNGKVKSTFIDIFGRSPATATEDVESCNMEDGKVGQCVPYYLCDENKTIIVDGSKLLDIRAGDIGGPCSTYLDVCCLPPQVRPTNNPIKPPPEPPRVGCGWRNPKGADMRTTGETDGETKFGEFPWMVIILRSLLPGVTESIGGGSLIAPNVVLTAAHRVFNSSPLKIRAGEWDTTTMGEIYPHQDRDVSSMEIHKDFNKRILSYDVALLFLSTPVDLAPHVGLACLPPPGRRTPAGTQCIATGWGKDKFGKEGQFQVILKKVVVPVIEQNTCQSAFRRTRLGRFFNLHHTFMCAGGEKGKDACRGDGGGPLSCPIPYQEDRYVQTGIVAWGIGCGEEGIPGAYVDVSSVRQWIDDKITRKGLDTSVYSF